MNPMIEAALKTNRLEDYRFELLSRAEASLGDLSTVDGGFISSSIFNEIRSGGIINLVEAGSKDIDWLNDRFRVYYRLNVKGHWYEWPIGVFLLSSPGQTCDGKVVKRTVEVYDKLKILTDDILEHSHTVAEGTKITNEIRSVIEATGEAAITITESDEEMPEARTWPPGTSRLRIVNDLLASINYFSLYVGGTGHYRVEPYVLPANRRTSWIFRDDKESLYKPEIMVDKDYFKIPNKVILMQSSFESAPLIATAVNIDPSSRYSEPSRGRWIVDYRQDLEATSIDKLQDRAERILAEAMQVTETIDYYHAWVPLQLHNAVRFSNSQLQLSAKYTLIEQTVQLTPGSLVKSTIRRVVT